MKTKLEQRVVSLALTLLILFSIIPNNMISTTAFADGGKTLDANMEHYLDGAISYSVMRNGEKVELPDDAKIFPDESFTISLKFLIPNDVTFSAGDITSIYFSSGFPFEATGNYLPMAGDLAEMAEYSVENPGRITLRFKEGSSTVSNISGSIQLTCTVQKFVESKNEIITQLGTLSRKVLNITEDTSSASSKASIEKTQTGYDPKTKQVTWLVKVETTDNQPLDGLRFIDILGVNHSFVSMNYRPDGAANWQSVNPEASNGGKTLTYEFPNGSGKLAQFKVLTKLDNGFIDGLETDKFVINTALLHRFDARLDTPAWVEIAKSEAQNQNSFTLLNSKSYSSMTATNDNRVKISYTLTLNRNCLPMPAGWTVRDEFTNDTDSSIKIQGVEIQNIKVTANAVPLLPGTDFTVNYNSATPGTAPFEIRFANSTDKTVTITYDAFFSVEMIKALPLTYGKHVIRNVLIDRYSKDAAVPAGINLDDLGLGTMPRVAKNILKIIPGATEADQRVQWESLINLEYKAVTEEATITDGMWSYYIKGKLDADSVQVYTKQQTDTDWTPQGKLTAWAGAKNLSFTGNTVYNPNSNVYTPMFSFKIDAATLSRTQVRLVYETPFIIIPTKNLVTHALENKITLVIGNETIEAKKRGSTHLGTATELKKGGSYDPVNEQFLWNITLTHKPGSSDGSSMSVSYYNPIIRDLALPAGHALVNNSVKATKDGAPFTVTWEEKDGGLIFKLDRIDPGNKNVVISVSFATKTTDNSWVQTAATNTARATLVSNTESESNGNTSFLESSATVNVDKTVELTKKTNYSTGEKVEWEVKIAPAENACLSGDVVKLTDKLPPQLSFDKVTAFKDLTTGLPEALPGAAYDSATNTVVFTLPDNINRTHTYQMIFGTNVVFDQELISNNIVLEAASYTTTTKSNLIYLRKNSSSGIITGNNAGLILLKQDPAGLPLNGATFLLAQKDLATGQTESREISVDKGGQVTITGLRYGTSNDLTTNSGYEYTLTEKTAPAGYQLSNVKWVIKIGRLNTLDPALTKFWINGSEVTSVRSYDGKPYAELTVVNEAQTSASLKLDAVKTVNGEAPLPSEIFSFELVEVDAAGRVIAGGYTETVQNNGAAISFGKIDYTDKDAGKTYYYKISEKYTFLNGYTIDNTSYTVKATVIRDNAGQLKITQTVTKNMEAAPLPDSMVFANRRDNQILRGSLTINKTVTGSGGDRMKDFTFTVTFSDNGAYNYTGSKTGSIKSGGSITLSHGQSVTIIGLPVGTSYTVAETESGKDGYITSSTGSSGKIIDGAVTASFINNRSHTKDKIPQTGDRSSFLLCLSLLVLSGAGLLLTVASYKRRRGK